VRASAPAVTAARPRAAGKFLRAGRETLWVRGVTYGPFRPGPEGLPYPPPDAVAADFAAMSAHGVNAVRVYTPPPRWLLDLAQHHGLRVMVGLAWEQHAAFLDDAALARRIVDSVRAGVEACAGHPAVLAYAVGNEIPSSIVRWHGARAVQRHLERLYVAAKRADHGALVTYVNYPTTEYLDLPWLDFVCFNVFLENEPSLDAYLGRLQHIAGSRPLLLGEIGLDSLRHGEAAQAETWQLRTAFNAGCAGAFVFSWTDEWHRGGCDVTDWAFGLTDAARRPKPALAAVQRTFAGVPFPPERRWPRISVVVCTRDRAPVLRECLTAATALSYPNYEIIVVNDGADGDTAAAAAAAGVHAINTPPVGLSAARNLGLTAATGEIVAYLDDDAVPDPHWLHFLAEAFDRPGVDAAGGPNIAPPGGGWVQECIARAPGHPAHILLSDREAEHVPGCNLAVRKHVLEAIGGFDPTFTVAGDDVDVCWNLIEAGHTIAFAPAAMVWHRRRGTIGAYWRQQRGYGEAEALLERKWPAKYSAAGHTRWLGRVYAPLAGGRRWRIYQGTWGLAPFQSRQARAPFFAWVAVGAPEWYLVIAGLLAFATLGSVWPAARAGNALLAVAVLASLIRAFASARRASAVDAGRPWIQRARDYLVVAELHLLQPAARLSGRLRGGLVPWRRRDIRAITAPWPRRLTVWSERGRTADEWLAQLELAARARDALVRRGGPYSRWDLEARGGMLGGARLRMAIEEHGAGRQLLRFRLRPTLPAGPCAIAGIAACLTALAVRDHAWVATAFLAATVFCTVAGMLWDSGAGMMAWLSTVPHLAADGPRARAGVPRIPLRGHGVGTAAAVTGRDPGFGPAVVPADGGGQ